VARILAHRGYADESSAREFLEPSIDGIRKDILPGTADLYERLLKARRDQEAVLVYGDPDADGVTGTVILLQALLRMGLRAHYYIPGRERDYYGVQAPALQSARQAGISLMITVDCGVIPPAVAAHLKDSGLEVVLTDHHPPIPMRDFKPLLFINPKLNDYPFPYLAGSGVAYKIADFIASNEGFEVRDLMPLAAVGTLADVMPPTGENRVMTRCGLDLLWEVDAPALKVLREALRLPKSLTETEVAYRIAPLLNAPGRRGTPEDAVEFFLSSSEEVALTHFRALLQKNKERKELSRGLLDEAIAQAEAFEPNEVPVVYSDRWYQSVVSQIAGQLVGHLNRPVIVLSVSRVNSTARGSGRSLPGFNLRAEVERVAKDLLEDIGGHPEAFGVMLKLENLPDFVQAMKTIRISVDQDPLKVDSEVQPGDLNPNFWKHLARLSPFGPLHPAPVLLIRKARVVSVERVGDRGRHLRVTLEKEGRKWPAFLAEGGKSWSRLLGGTYSVVFSPSRDLFSYRPVLEIRDLKAAG
jgi:single-stranded-DNA-specific exonuclease